VQAGGAEMRVAPLPQAAERFVSPCIAPGFAERNARCVSSLILM
jgi:hypothetical protein